MVDPQPGRHLLAASTGGHLAQLCKWSTTLGSSDDSLFVTFDTPQSRSLLDGRRVMYVPYIAPRDYRHAGTAFYRLMRRIDWKSERFTAAVSTGAALAVSALAAARFHRVPSCYIESVSRVKGPSASGRIVALDRKIDISCQYRSWVHGRWYYRGTLFDQYEAVAHDSVEKPRLFVTLGTIAPYRFDAMVDAILATGLADERTIWQLGCTGRTDLPGRVCEQMSGREFDACVEDADVVITHSGVGTIMKLLDMGVCPVVIPRRVGRKEHVDDHQVQIAGVVEERGIAVVAEAPELTREAVVRASSITVRIPGTNAPSVQVPDSLEGTFDLEMPRSHPDDKGHLV